MNSLEFIKQHVTEWPGDLYGCVILFENGYVNFYVKSVGHRDSHINLSEHFAPDYYDGKVWTREEFEACGKPTVDWIDAPSWATSYGVAESIEGHVWYNHQQYAYTNAPKRVYEFSGHYNFDIDDITHVESRPTPDTETSAGIDATVEERGNRYGTFKDGADIMQELKSVMRSTPNWSKLTPSQREALEMIQHKVGRILNGDPNYTDSWHDIKGYAHLIEEELNGNAK